MLFVLFYRDIKIKYSTSFLGLFWTFFQPLVALIIYSFFFSVLIRIETEIPYSLFVLSGFSPWFYFTFVISSAGSSLIDSQDLIKKVYFPRLLLPFSKVITGLIELGVSLVLLFIFMLIMGHPPTYKIIFLPFFIVLNIIMGLSLAIWQSAISVRYRDVMHLIPVVIGAAIWLTPVFFPVDMIPEDYQYLLYLNPMAGVIGGYRWAILGMDSLDFNYFISYFVMLLILIAGIHRFYKIEENLADSV